MSRSAPRWQADLALAGITLIWGATFVLVKEALSGISTLLFLALRFSIASLALAAAFRGRLGAFHPRSRAFRGGLLAGVFLFAGYVFQTFGLRLTTPSKSAFLTGLSIVLVPLFGAAVYKKAPQLAEMLGVAVAAAGMALLTLEGASLRIGPGDLLTLCCAVAFAFHILTVGRILTSGGFEVLSLAQISASAVLAWSICWWAETPAMKWTPPVLGALAVTGLLATALAFSVQAWAQQHTTATRTALIFALEPVFAWMTSYLLQGETLSRPAAGGAVMILAGILLVELKPPPPRQHPSNQTEGPAEPAVPPAAREDPG